MYFLDILIKMRPSICFLLLATFCASAFSQTAPLNYRLDTNVLPSNYDINLTPYITLDSGERRFTFDGTTRITLATALANQRSIVLHSKFLTIQTATLQEVSEQQTPIFILSQDLNNVTDKLTLTLQSDLRQNVNYVLEFVYTGILQTDMSGFYRSVYVENGIEK